MWGYWRAVFISSRGCSRSYTRTGRHPSYCGQQQHSRFPYPRLSFEKRLPLGFFYIFRPSFSGSLSFAVNDLPWLYAHSPFFSRSPPYLAPLTRRLYTLPTLCSDLFLPIYLDFFVLFCLHNTHCSLSTYTLPHRVPLIRHRSRPLPFAPHSLPPLLICSRSSSPLSRHSVCPCVLCIYSTDNASLLPSFLLLRSLSIHLRSFPVQSSFFLLSFPFFLFDKGLVFKV